MRYIRSIQSILITGASLLIAASTLAVGIGPDANNPSLLTSHKLPENGDTWTIGENNPSLISFDADAGVWRKSLLPYFEGNALPELPVIRFLGDNLFLTEFVEIDSGPGWRGWREEMVEANGWVWTSGVVEFGGNDELADVVPGSFFNIDPDQVIEFTFDALPAGTILEIRKSLQCADNQGCQVSLKVDEFAAVPIPGALLMISGPLLALLVRIPRQAG